MTRSLSLSENSRGRASKNSSRRWWTFPAHWWIRRRRSSRRALTTATCSHYRGREKWRLTAISLASRQPWKRTRAHAITLVLFQNTGWISSPRPGSRAESSAFWSVARRRRRRPRKSSATVRFGGIFENRHFSRQMWAKKYSNLQIASLALDFARTGLRFTFTFGKLVVNCTNWWMKVG